MLNSSALESLKIDKSAPVLVTGATGYVAGVLIQQLLELGVTVHGTVRNPTDTTRFQYLIDLAEKSPGTLKFFKGDLEEEGTFEEGMQGCSVVFHTASPFTLSVNDPQKDLVDPAVNGTRNILNEATKSGTVKRVVLTSSCAAIYNDASDTEKAPGKKLTEEIWNTGSNLSYNPYSYSKTKAELAAWEIAGSQTKWTLVVMNPCMVMGPGTKYHESSESFSMIKRLGGGKSASGCPNFCMGVVDVRVSNNQRTIAYRLLLNFMRVTDSLPCSRRSHQLISLALILTRPKGDTFYVELTLDLRKWPKSCAKSFLNTLFPNARFPKLCFG